MLTVKQLLIVSGQDPRDGMHVSALRQQFSGPSKAFSIAKIIAAFEMQRRVYFVSLISPRIFLSDSVQNLADLVRFASDPPGQMTETEVDALSTNLENYGVLLRLVDKDLQRAAIVGTVSSLLNAPTTMVDASNFSTIKDWVSGAKDIATGVGLAGAGGLAIVAIPAVVIEGSPIIVFGSAVVLGAAAGWFIGNGIFDVLENSTPPPATPSPDKTKSEIDSPDTQPDGSDPETIEIPNALAVGDPPSGLDVDGLVTDIGNFALDLTLTEIPVGWDPDAGSALPSLGTGDVSGGDGGDGGGAGGGFPA